MIIQFNLLKQMDTISEVAENNKVINLMDYLNLQKTIYRSDAV